MTPKCDLPQIYLSTQKVVKMSAIYHINTTPIHANKRESTVSLTEADGRFAVMKLMYLGMFAMMDITAAVLAQTSDSLWDRHFYHSLIGSTLAVVAFGTLYEVKQQIWLARRSVAAIAIGIVAGPFTAELSSQWLKTEMNSMSVVLAAFIWSFGGPYAIQKYGERAIDSGADYLHLKSGSNEQHSIETPDNRNDETVNGK